jgi:hypothetical protein
MDFSTYADWAMIAFFLWFGLKKFIPALEQGYFQYVGAVLALLVAAFTMLSM